MLTSIGLLILEHDLPALLRFASCCHALRARLKAVAAEANKRRVRLQVVPWLLEDGAAQISRHGTKAEISRDSTSDPGALVSDPLPTKGCWRWTVTISPTSDPAGFHRIGVTEGATCTSWLAPARGHWKSPKAELPPFQSPLKH